MLIPSAPSARAATSPRPSANPPDATIDGDLFGGGRDEHEPGDVVLAGWPAHSKPSMLMPSTPLSWALIACRTLVHLCSTFTPAAWKSGRCGAGLEPAVSTILMPDSMMTCRYSSYGGGVIAGRIVRFTPKAGR